MPKFVERAPSQLYLLPPDIRDWVPEDDLAHFVLEAVERVPMSTFQVNERGTGSAQYHPRMMLALLIYCYANGIFGLRRIERATYRDLGVRYVAADCHPDHDTICAFRRQNIEAVSEAFLQVLLMARELKLLKVGTVSVDGTQLRANASKRNSIRRDRAVALRKQLRGEIDDLLGEAERADIQDAPDPQSSPEELKRRKTLKAKLDRACAELERRAKSRAGSERAEYERKVAAREQREGRRKGQRIKPPREEPRPEEQINLTDSDSALMRKNKRSEYRQCYNAQAVVDAEGSQLVVGTRVSPCASDRGELGGGRGFDTRRAGFAGSGIGGQRVRDRVGGCGTGESRPGGPGGGRDGGRPACARFSAADTGEAGQGTEGGLAQAHAGEDGDRRKPSALPLAETDGGAGVRDRQGGDGIPAVFAARIGEGGGGVGLGDAGL